VEDSCRSITGLGKYFHSEVLLVVDENYATVGQ